MPITGSQKALMQCRSAVARCGATRSGYYFPNQIIKINAVDRSAFVDKATIQITDNLNDQPNTASFSVRSSVAVSEGHAIIIALGTDAIAQRLFAGQVVKVTQRQVAQDFKVYYDVEAVDYTWKLDRRKVTTDYRSTSATTIAKDLISSFTTGGFTTNNVVLGLATIDIFPCTNTRVSTALTRLANLIGGAWYIDYNQDLHFFVTNTEQNPISLTDTYGGFWDFDRSADLAQVRTKIIVEGMRTSCPLSIPTAVTLPGTQTLPVEDSSPFNETGGVARIGSQRVTYTSRNYPVASGLNAEGTRVTANAAAGATSVTIASNAWVAATGTSWCQIGDQIIYFGGSDGGVPDINTIPSSGFGSIQHAIGVGESVRALGMLVGVSGLTLSYPAGTEVVMRVEQNDATAQSNLAALEGGDGIHEHIVQDGRLDEAGAIDRATSELTVFKESIKAITYKTRNPHTASGRSITVSLSAPTSVSGTFVIQRVQISDFDYTANRTVGSKLAFPVRTVEASSLKQADLTDLLRTGDDAPPAESPTFTQQVWVN